MALTHHPHDGDDDDDDYGDDDDDDGDDDDDDDMKMMTMIGPTPFSISDDEDRITESISSNII